MAADLHLHTTASDGCFSPQTVVEMAREAQLTAISITDHDTVDGLEEALEWGERVGLPVIPGIELSTLFQEKEIHILGYFINYRNPSLQSTLQRLIQSRITRAEKMVERLNQMGISIQLERIRERAKTPYIGRPHIAWALKEEGYIQELGEAFTSRFIGRGGRAYVERYKITPQEAITLIKKTGGLAVLAHPGLIHRNGRFKAVQLTPLLEAGLDGIEVFYSGHRREEKDYYHQLALEKGLLITGGSDFHHLDGKSPTMGQYLPHQYLSFLYKRAGQKL